MHHKAMQHTLPVLVISLLYHGHVPCTRIDSLVFVKDVPQGQGSLLLHSGPPGVPSVCGQFLRQVWLLCAAYVPRMVLRCLCTSPSSMHVCHFEFLVPSLGQVWSQVCRGQTALGMCPWAGHCCLSVQPRSRRVFLPFTFSPSAEFVIKRVTTVGDYFQKPVKRLQLHLCLLAQV
jgi:hypothetical protein